MFLIVYIYIHNIYIYIYETYSISIIVYGLRFILQGVKLLIPAPRPYYPLEAHSILTAVARQIYPLIL